jgi:hypothetical protein
MEYKTRYDSYPLAPYVPPVLMVLTLTKSEETFLLRFLLKTCAVQQNESLPFTMALP